MSVLCRCVAVAVLWWTLVLALPAQAWSITDFPQIDCADTDLEHCSQCHYATIGGVTHFLCAICVDTATTRYSQATQGQNFATCQVYNGNCEMHDCDKCGSDDPKICVACNHGVPDQETSECLGETVSSATGGLYTSSKAPTPVPVPVTTTTTTTPVPVPVTTTTTTTPAPVPVTTTTTTTPVPVPVTTTTTIQVWLLLLSLPGQAQVWLLWWSLPGQAQVWLLWWSLPGQAQVWLLWWSLLGPGQT
ncbi:hypothetical protein ABB37_08366 [Leptomonas pyrrhocoris]|uniref:Surface antigen-like protein n=1 Tax=Leptomonas pyrrhocoris TaxID=157538 RepID=A0A0M9FT53_LEPPY|nr:hypothetical protein ABB37_08366 [Leptomonas pyrrhocoris]XP_015653886.1 hypothetical protein ABB37_08366 [Leptomonas pyrrhocoris]KPA75446.1 hypothetical protein ABB37_08366 [Leptomonas pyrrhocoris]KPA75447.1 hypothetical protein ABB37_08366 [Leptomonas pyrrhocoris]|eukprot:XP_015653885.1 hypothetical protein ABB37_08366 [Leptomonas pyrrhocoris]